MSQDRLDTDMGGDRGQNPLSRGVVPLSPVPPIGCPVPEPGVLRCVESAH